MARSRPMKGRAVPTIAALQVEIGADTRGAERGFAQTNALLARLQRESGLANSEVNRMTTGLASAASSAHGFGGAIGGLGDGLSKLGLAAGGLGAIKTALGGVANLLSAPIQAASDLNESLSKVDVVFGENAAAIKAFSDTAAQSLGQSKAEALSAAGQFGNLFKAMGLGQTETADLSKQIVSLGSDLASFNNIKPEDALEKLRAGLVGEAEPLRTLGVNLNETIVKAKALAMGFTEVDGQLSESAKIQARYALILEQTKDAQGDFSRTSTGMANAQRIISASFADLQTQLGSQVLPVIAPLISAFAQGLPGAMQAIQPALSALGGTLQEFGGTLGGLADSAAIFLGLDPGEFSDAWSELGGIFNQLQKAVEPLVSVFTDGFQGLSLVVQQALTGDVTSALQNFGDLIGTFSGRLTDVLGEWGAAFAAWIGPAIPPMVRELLAMVVQIDTWIVQTGLPMLVTQLGEWAGAFVDWVGPLIPPLLRELGAMALQVGSWMLNTALPAMVGNLLKWGLAFVGWVAPRIPQLMGEVIKLELELGRWILTEALPAIVGKLAEWGGAFLGWIAKDVLPFLPNKLIEILNAISTWATGALNSIADEAGKLGAGFIQGIQDGIGGAIGGFQNWLKANFVDKLPEWVRTWLDIKSPSGVFEEIGGQMVAGLQQGISKRFPDVQAMVGSLMQGMTGPLAGAFDQVNLGSGEIADYIRAAAAIRGINPNTAVRVAMSEGGVSEPARRGTFSTGSSWWPFQLHYGGRGTPYEFLGTTAGMGNAFTAATGFQPGDPAAWRASIDYALNAAKENGWGAWYGAATAGIGNWEGIEGRMLGGFMQAGRNYLVGERHPEVISVGANSWAHPNPELEMPSPAAAMRGKGGGGFTWNGDLTVVTQAKDAREMAEELRNELTKIANKNGGPDRLFR